MLSEMSQKVQNSLPLLFPYFSAHNPLETDTGIVGRYIASILPVRSVALVRTLRCTAFVWNPENIECRPVRLTDLLLENQNTLREQVEKHKLLEGEALQAMLELEPEYPVMLCGIQFDSRTYGLLFVQRDGEAWETDEIEMLTTLSGTMGAAFATRVSIENEELSSFVFNTMLDTMKASIYITDVDSDRILFMNQTMKKAFGVEHPEGNICWKVLQTNMNGRCPFCPVGQLQSGEQHETVIQWDEQNTANGRSYRNYDSLVRWIDGSIVHLQQSIDVTDLKSANTDELTQMFTRRAGKEALGNALESARKAGKTVTVCLYDINDLKRVNDQYGHAEGDRFISATANVVRNVLTPQDFAFRLSGDEFVVVFSCGSAEAHPRMGEALRALCAEQGAYPMSFSYGLVEVSPAYETSVNDVLSIADEQMYEQKRVFHILQNEKRLRFSGEKSKSGHFDYDKEHLYDALVQTTEDYLFICNMKNDSFRFPPRMVHEFDLPGEIIENAAAVWGSRVHQADKKAFLESYQDVVDGRTRAHCVEYRVKNRYGDWVWVRCRGHAELDEDGRPVLFAGFITDLGQKSKTDNLTGLFNKLEFESQVNHLLAASPNPQFAMVIIGVDNMKHINDLYDRAFGDEVLRITAQRLQTLLPGTVSLFRLDGDEFGLIVHGGKPEELQALWDMVHANFDRQQEYDGKKYYCTLSAGCSFYPRDGGGFLELFKYAGYSLEYSKSHGKKCYTLFSEKILAHRSRTLAMVEALRDSVNHDYRGFSLRYQPIVKAETGKLTGLEALARWECERFGAVSPIEFIPLLEQTGLIVQVGKWVLHEAMRTSLVWCKIMPEIMVHVNLSYHQIGGEDFVPFLQGALEECAYDPQNLVLEMTESYFAQEDEHVQAVFSQLRSMGVRIAMDDFGTGYSALGLLKRSPADIVKVDKTFISDILTSSFDATFIRFIVALCHDVGIKVCLEGVETEAEYDLVSTMGLDDIQGFYFNKPLTAGEFGEQYFK